MNFTKEMKIGDKLVGDNHPCFIIAEAGVNHNGDIRLAKKLVDEAKNCGVDAVKFQTWITEELMVPELKTAEYHKEFSGYDNFFDMAKKLELSYDEFRELKSYCDEKNIIFLSTPDEEKSTDFLNSIGVSAFKISSPEFNNPRMIKHILKYNKPTIISTGMNSEEQIEKTLQDIKNLDNKDIVILHCTSEYPAPLDSVNMNFMKNLKEKYNCVIGYSDHTQGTTIAPIAIAAGAKVYEKHFTLDKNMPGPDHKTSIDPEEMKTLVRNIRETEKIMGSYNKIVTETEETNSQVMKKVIVASKNIEEGQILSCEDIIMKRAESGIEPRFEKEIVGKTINRNIKKDEVIRKEDLI